jgi:transposase
MLEWDTPALSERLRDHPEFRPQAILRVLCYAYATSVFSSEEVRRRCYSDPIFIGLCDGSPPFAEELMNFRRKNRGLIAALLSRVLQKVFRQKFEIKEFHGLAGLRKLCTDTAVERLNIARHIDRLDG